MLLRRLDDYQGWQVVFGGTSLLLDPWLTDESITGSFDRHRSAQAVSLESLREASTEIAGILLCTSVSDHARPATLSALSHVPVFGPAAAMRVARAAGSQVTHAMRPGDQRDFAAPEGGRLIVTATRTGLPLGLIAIGYLVEARDASGACAGRIWLEPHQPTRSVAAALAPVDIALLPVESVTAVVMPVTAGLGASLRAAEFARAAVIVPTATDPRRDMSRWQRILYRVRGGTTAGAAGPPIPIATMVAGATRPVRSSAGEPASAGERA